jgi:hypothetical protein
MAKSKIGTTPATFRLAATTRAELHVIRELLQLSTETAALQFAVRRTYNQLPDLVPVSAVHLSSAAPVEAAGPGGTDAAARVLLQSAYERIDRVVFDGPGEWPIRLHEPCREADALLQPGGVEHWAYVGAENPRSIRLTQLDNVARTKELDAQLARLSGVVAYRGESRDPDGFRPPEAGRLVLGINEDDANRLAVLFGQFGYVRGRRGEAAEFKAAR